MILQWPNKILNEIAVSIPDKETAKKFLPHFKELIKRYQEKAVGLAAPQTGLSYSLIWIRDFGIMINPVIVSSSEEKIASYESCLSIAGLAFTVNRSKKITVIYRDEQFKKKKKIFRDRWAIIAQHEIDHLYGKTLKETGTEVILSAGPPAEA